MGAGINYQKIQSGVDQHVFGIENMGAFCLTGSVFPKKYLLRLKGGAEMCWPNEEIKNSRKIGEGRGVRDESLA